MSENVPQRHPGHLIKLRKFCVRLKNALTWAESSKLVCQPASCRRVGASLACKASRHGPTPSRDSASPSPAKRPPSLQLAALRWRSSGAAPGHPVCTQVSKLVQGSNYQVCEVLVGIIKKG